MEIIYFNFIFKCSKKDQIYVNFVKFMGGVNSFYTR